MREFLTSLRSVSDFTIRIDGPIRLWADLGRYVTPALFEVARALAIEVIMCTRLMEKHVRCIDPDRPVLTLRNGSKVSNLSFCSTQTIGRVNLENMKDLTNPSVSWPIWRRIRHIPRPRVCPDEPNWDFRTLDLPSFLHHIDYAHCKGHCLGCPQQTSINGR